MPRFATWNVNSLKVRQDRVVQWLTDIAPDIVCLQETKLADGAFPQLAFEALGFTAVHHGEGRWNGVAMLSRKGLDNVSFGFADGLEPDSEARIMTATSDGITVVNVYVPNGRVVGSDHYAYKLSWLERLGAHVDAVVEPGARSHRRRRLQRRADRRRRVRPCRLRRGDPRDRAGAGCRHRATRPRSHRPVPAPASRSGEGVLVVGLPPR